MPRVLIVGALALAAVAAAQPNPANTELHMVPVQGNVYMLVGAGGNITVSVGKDGILLVDSGLAAMAPKVLAAIRELSNKPLRYIINTHVHPDHVGGNELLHKEGSTIAGGNVAGNISDAGEGAQILAHENLLRRMTDQKPPLPFGALPTDTYFTKSKEVFFNGEALQILHEPAAHTDGDSMIFFRRSDVISTGDIFTPANYPFIDLERGGSIQGEIDALNHIIELTIPAEKQEGGTYVIPGHGRICDEADVVEYRDMVTIIRDRIFDMVKKGMTLDQVKAAKPTRDYDPLYGSATGFGTPERFVEGVYKSLSPKK